MTQHPSFGVIPEIGSLRLCFYGAGAMTEAFVRGILDRSLTEPGQICVMNRQNATRLDELSNRYGIQAASDDPSKQSMLRQADLIFFAMKPKDAASAIKQLRGVIQPHQLLISFVAGLSTETIEELLGHQNAIIRTMPNTSSTIGLGATGVSFSSAVTKSQRLVAEQLLQAVGLTVIVEEALLDVVTGVSGSGPAYVYYLMEAMIKAGHGLGLSENTARELTIQTVLGAAHMVKASNENPADLRNKVTSPGGTTQAAIEALDAHHFSKAIIQAVERAAERAAEMGNEIKRSDKS